MSTFLKKLLLSSIFKLLVNHSCGFCWTLSQVTALCRLSIYALKKRQIILVNSTPAWRGKKHLSSFLSAPNSPEGGCTEPPKIPASPGAGEAAGPFNLGTGVRRERRWGRREAARSGTQWCCETAPSRVRGSTRGQKGRDSAFSSPCRASDSPPGREGGNARGLVRFWSEILADKSGLAAVGLRPALPPG